MTPPLAEQGLSAEAVAFIRRMLDWNCERFAAEDLAFKKGRQLGHTNARMEAPLG